MYGDFSFVAVCILKRSDLGVTSRPDRDGRAYARPNQQLPKLRHANTMPTHANKMDKTGANSPVLRKVNALACVRLAVHPTDGESTEELCQQNDYMTGECHFFCLRSKLFDMVRMEAAKHGKCLTPSDFSR